MLNFFDLENVARCRAKEEYRRWVNYEETTWRQKSREGWQKEGNRNTKFFHGMANFHRKWNWISKLQFGEEWEQMIIS